jgi:hypothetical protein
MRSIPVTILGGSDQKPGSMPASGGKLHPLATYKGVAIELEGQPLVALLVERLAATEGFGPVTIAGPRRVYGPLGLGARLLDTDGSVATNLRAAIDDHAAGNDGPMAVLACDVLPSTEELALLRRRYEQEAPCALWFPFVRVPSDPAALGAFAWKPAYTMVLPTGEAVPILPGHLGIFEPAVLRLPLLYRLLDAAYRTRNRSVRFRRAVMLRTVLLSLVAKDLKRLLRLRFPNLTWTVVRNGLVLARELRSGRTRLVELEGLIGRIFLRDPWWACRGRRERGIRFPILDTIRLAEDVDTEEEARAIQGRVRPLPTP